MSFGLKMRLYKSTICPLFTYGSKAWTIDDRTRAAINGANAKCISRITGRRIHEEVSVKTRTFDLLVREIRKWRYKWLGHILRMKRSRLVKHAITVQFVRGTPGSIFMDAPTNFTYRGLEQLTRKSVVTYEPVGCLRVFF